MTAHNYPDASDAHAGAHNYPDASDAHAGAHNYARPLCTAPGVTKTRKYPLETPDQNHTHGANPNRKHTGNVLEDNRTRSTARKTRNEHPLRLDAVHPLHNS